MYRALQVLGLTAPNFLAQYDHSFPAIAYRFRPCAWADFTQADDLTGQKLA
jgi:hypothetical protein